MNILEPDDITFAETGGGGLSLETADGVTHSPVFCIRLFPLSCPDSYISVLQGDEKDRPEIGILRDLNELPDDQRKLVESDLSRNHFLPEILDIARVRLIHGVDEWSVATDRGEKTFFVSGRKDSIVATEDNMLIITDIEKCRYRVTDYNELSPRARFYLERALP